jgi:hypothetical protein
MITTFILTLFNSFLSFLLQFLPTGTLPSGLVSAIGYFWSAINSFSYIFPVGTLLLALLFLVAFDFAIVFWHFIQWVIRKIPGMN